MSESSEAGGSVGRRRHATALRPFARGAETALVAVAVAAVVGARSRGALPPVAREARPRALGPARLDRHAARRRPRLLRPRGRRHALDRPPGRGGRALRDGPRPQRRHPALPRQPALGPATRCSTACATTPASASRPTADARHAAAGERLAHGGVRERVPPRLALRPRPRLRRLRRPPRRGRDARRVPRAGAARDARRSAAARALDRDACAASASSPSSTSTSRTSPTSRRSPSPRASAASPTTARWRRRTPPSSRCSRRSSSGGRARATLVVLTSRPRRVARRARRGDPRRLRLRGDAARAARPLRARALRARASCARRCATSTSLPTVLDAAGARASRRTSRAAACCPLIAGRRRARPDELLRGARARRSTAAGRRCTASSHGGLKYVDLPLPELYDLARGPRASGGTSPPRARRTSSACAARLARLRARRRAAWGPRPGGGGDASSACARSATSPGRGRPRRSATREDDDPKRLDRDRQPRSETWSRCYRAGDYDGAIALVPRRSSAAAPTCPSPTCSSPTSSGARGRLDARRSRAARKAVDLRPARRRGVSLHGVYLTEAGRPGEALAFLEPVRAATRRRTSTC